MATEQDRINVISDAEESTEDRGPLVQDEELNEVRTMVEESTNNIPGSADDVLAFLEADDVEKEVSSNESYIDNRVMVARDIRPMIAAWHEYKGAMSQVKANYKLWKVESELSGGDVQDQRKENLIQSASRIKNSLDFIEGEIKEAFPQLQGVAFLTRSELLVLPTWMHDLLNITIEATTEERLAAETALQETMESNSPQE